MVRRVINIAPRPHQTKLMVKKLAKKTKQSREFSVTSGRINHTEKKSPEVSVMKGRLKNTEGC